MSVFVSTYNFNASLRWNFIQTKLTKQMDHDTIICLQNLSDKWLSLLIPFFDKKSYKFIYDSQNAGVAIAFPYYLFDFDAIDFFHIGEKMKEKCFLQPAPIKTSSFWQMASNLFLQYWNIGIKQNTKQTITIWEEAISKPNRMLRVCLYHKYTKQYFNLFTYQMPNGSNDLLNLHATFVLAEAQEKSKDIPYMLAGNFNVLPGSSVYNLFTENKLPSFPHSETFHMPTSLLLTLTPLKSAFKDINDKKIIYPIVWNTTDYIFLSTQPEIENCAFLRIEQQGSDHLEILFEIGSNQKQQQKQQKNDKQLLYIPQIPESELLTRLS
jgi:hypothetical protein